MSNSVVIINSSCVPALVVAAGERASMRFLEFFAANIRNPHTRRRTAQPQASALIKASARRSASASQGSHRTLRWRRQS
jgi:hypothetical protein